MRVLCGKVVACLHRDNVVVLLPGETNQAYIYLVMGYAAPVRSHRLQTGSQTRLVACASIASYVFTQLIQLPGVEQSILIRVPGAREVGFEIGIVSLA
jgi:hypothetical protein